LANYDYEYQRSFEVDKELLNSDKILLSCEGLDTPAEIVINNQQVARTENMHRSYEFDVKDLLKEGENQISIIFYSPTKYIEQKQENKSLWGVGDAIAGYPHLRKAHYMFGWDWGPQLPDAGIWRDISIKGYETARLEDVYITQNHKQDKVSLDIRIRQ